MGRARDPPRRDAQRARQRRGPRRARGLHDRRPVHRAAAGAAVRGRGRRPIPATLRIGVRTVAPRRPRRDRSRVRRRGRGRGRAARVARPHGRGRGAGRARRGRAHGAVRRGDDVVACVRDARRDRARSSGRPLTADDVEPLTWLYYEASGGYDGGAYVDARRTRCTAGPAASCRGGTTTASTSCSRRRSPSRRPCSATSAARTTAGSTRPRGRAVRRVLHRAVQRDRPARDVGAVVLERRGPADRRAARRRAVPRGPADPGRRPARTSTAVGASAARRCTPDVRRIEVRMTDLVPARRDRAGRARPQRRGVAARARRRRDHPHREAQPRAQRGDPSAVRPARASRRGGALPDGPFRGVPILFKDLDRPASRATRSTRACSS